MKTHRHVLLAVAVAVGVPCSSQAQSLEDRIATSAGSVGFEYATRGNVCGNGESIFISEDISAGWNVRPHRSGTHLGRGGNDGERCDIAPARGVVEHEGRRITSIRVSVGGMVGRAGSELGRVPAEEAVRLFLTAAPQLSGRSADEALTGASIAAVPKVWPRLIEIARDDAASESSRKSAMFWLSREAAVAAVAGLSAVAEDDAATTSVRSDALFHLAHRPDGAGIEPLIRVVRQSKSARIRKDALWFLGQSGDPRALALITDLLTKQ
jgi:hypothetical protein